MGVFEDVILNVKSALDTVGKKTGDFVDLSKLKLNESEIKSGISKNYEQLGKLTYKSIKNDYDNKEEITNCISEIDRLYTELKEIQGQISTMKKVKVCCKCGNENDQEMKYCGYCGAKLTQEVVVDIDEQKENSEQSSNKESDNAYKEEDNKEASEKETSETIK